MRLEIVDGADGVVGGSLVLIRSDCSEVWRVMSPQGSHDRWTEAYVDGEHVVALSWSCYRVTIDAATGDELSRTFTK